MLRVGDWVQAVERIDEDNFPEDGVYWVHAEPGELGHILRLQDPGAPTVLFERSGTVTDVRLDQIIKVCDFAGRFVSPVPFRTPRA